MGDFQGHPFRGNQYGGSRGVNVSRGDYLRDSETEKRRQANFKLLQQGARDYLKNQEAVEVMIKTFREKPLTKLERQRMKAGNLTLEDIFIDRKAGDALKAKLQSRNERLTAYMMPRKTK